MLRKPGALRFESIETYDFDRLQFHRDFIGVPDGRTIDQRRALHTAVSRNIRRHERFGVIAARDRRTIAAIFATFAPPQADAERGVATVVDALEFGIDGPKFSSGNSIRIKPAFKAPPSAGRVAPGRPPDAGVPVSSTSTTRAPCRATNSRVSPGTAIKVPLDCSPAITAATCPSGKNDSIAYVAVTDSVDLSTPWRKRWWQSRS